nr:sterol carrier family protein [Phytoactinopolyspora alkaliphila]
MVLRSWIEGVPESSWERESVLPGWAVADLVAHLATVADSVTALEPAARGVAAAGLGDYLAAYAPVADGIAERARELAADAGRYPGAIMTTVDERFAAAVDALDRIGLHDQVVVGRRGAIRLGDYLLTRAVEIAVHADDLARSVPVAGPLKLPKDTVRLAVRALLEVVAQRAPGRTVEVRVPPHAAVQCVEGPRHTRGTPPNVVEMDATTWLRLAAGRTRWADELAAAHVSASGDRADLSAYLPVL